MTLRKKFLDKTVFKVGILLFLTLTGCRSLPLIPGHYEGNLLQSKQGLIQDMPVGIEVIQESSRMGRVAILSVDGRVKIEVLIEAISSKIFEVRIPGFFNQPALFQSEGECFIYQASEPSNASYRGQLCFAVDGFFLEITRFDRSPLLVLSGDRFKREVPLRLENPKNYSLKEATEIALNKNFESRVQYEHMIQAKHSAKASYLNLLPHLSLSSILSAAIPSAIGLLGSIGDLAPFLLPTRWYSAKIATSQSQVERDALSLMRADLAAQIEGLSYALERDKRTEEYYKKLFNRAQEARVLIDHLEKQGRLTAGSLDHLDTSLNSMTLDIFSLKTLVKMDKIALGQAMGLFNPQGVQDIELGFEEMPIENAVVIDSEKITQIALGRSFELRQMDSLIQIARFQKTTLYFNWLDPSGNSSVNLGFGLADIVIAAKSRIEELNIKRERLQALIVQKVYESVAAYDGTLLGYSITEQNLELQERRLVRMLSQIQPESGFSALDLQSILHDYLSAAVRREALIASFRIARSKVDRFLLQGPVQRLRHGAKPSL